MSCTSYWALTRERQRAHPFLELCHAAPMHSYPLAADRPVSFSELIVHKENQ